MNQSQHHKECGKPSATPRGQCGQAGRRRDGHVWWWQDCGLSRFRSVWTSTPS